jgi:DUF4097 and DUF4098 domain-containing protein YvlB
MRLSLVLIYCLLIPGLFSQEPAQTPTPAPASPYVDREEKEFNFFPGGKIEIFAGVRGSVKIVGWKKGSVRVEAEKIIYYESQEKAQAFLKKSPLRVRWSQTTVTIRTSGAPELPAVMEVNLTLYVPGEKTDVNAKMDQGDFSIESVNGWIEASIKEGSVDAKSLGGYFSATTLRGDIFADMSGHRWNGYEFAALTQKGSATLLLPPKFSAALQIETRDGKISVDYPPQVVEGEETPPDIIISKKSQSLKASIGDGGAPVKLFTYSGDVAVSMKKE